MAAGLDQGAGRPITNAGGQLFFSVNEQNGTQLWTSDGTEAGTQIVRDVAAGTYFNLPLMLGSQRMFIGSDDQGFALWRTDGTSAGTTVALRLTDVNDVVRATVFNNILYFFDLEATGISLWRSDATAAGTYKVTQIRSDTNRPIPSTIVKSGDKFYFLAADSEHGYELWASNGTASGTGMLLDLDPEAYSSQLSALTDVEGTLYFVRESPPYEKFELWKSQGTAASTSKVANLPHYYDEVYNVKRGPQQLTSAGGKLFFTIQEDSRGYRLWVSDGSAQGTKRVQGADGPTIAREPRQMVRFGDVLLFAASGDRHGDELWRSDGTAAGTYRVKDIAPGPADSGIFTLTALGDERQALFAATDGLRGSEVWVTDGTTQGTWRVEDIASGPRSANPTQFTEVNSSIFFFANDHISGRELWVMPRSALVLPPATPTASPTPSTTPIPSSTPTQRPEAYNMYLPTLQR
jgi:ELWxxDGT repeat protein